MKLLLGLVFAVCFASAQDTLLFGNDEVDMATTEFAMDMYKEISRISKKEENIFFSPLSIYTAFAMLKAGAKQNTAKELEDAMRWELFSKKSNQEDGHKAIKKLLANVFTPLANNNTISIANRLWMQKNFCTSRCNSFIKTLQESYDAGLEQLNFVTDASNSRKQINGWVEKKTMMKIKDLMPEGSINALTRFVLTNAIYFKSMWKNQFKKSETRMDYFDAITKSGFTRKSVPMMFQNGEFFSSGYIPSAEYQLLEMPYEGDSLSMVVVVPNGFSEIQKLEQSSLSAGTFKKMLQELYEYPSTNLDLYFPKFKIETNLNLKGYMQTMGVRDVFNRATADLSGIVGYRGMYVSDAVHKAYVSVDEQGTEAAAATGLGVRFTSLPFSYKVDKPFLFFIRHIKTGTIIFMGRVMDPSSAM